jgi:hypothetical protein
LQQSDLIIAVFEFVLLIFSLCVHECAHAWMASRLGDQTARRVAQGGSEIICKVLKINIGGVGVLIKW